MSNPRSKRLSNPFIPPTGVRGSLAYITGRAVSPKPLGNLPIAKSDSFETPFLFAQYSPYGFKFDTVQLYGESGWYFPKHASESYTTCGEYTYQGCLSPTHQGQAFVRAIHYNCGRAGCPVCGGTWILETAKKMVDRIEKASKVLKHNYGWRRTSPIHVTVSPPQSEWAQYTNIKNYNKLRQKAQKAAKMAGFTGGSIIFHPYRERCAKCGGEILFKQQKCKECGCEDIVWYWAPHWHLFGFGWIRGKIAYNATGYLVKNHGIRSDLGATAYYQLTHCGIREGKHALTWFGILHYSKLSLPPYESECVGATECPICGNKLRMLRYHGTKPPPLNETGEWVGSTGWEYRYGGGA